MDLDLLRRLDRARERLGAEPLALREAAREACISPFHFHRQFVRAFGQTPGAFATARRLERAKTLLLTTDLLVSEVCRTVGYESPGSFSSRFAREFGLPPTEYRKGARRFWRIDGVRSSRFIPLCFAQNGKIREAAPRP